MSAIWLALHDSSLQDWAVEAAWHFDEIQRLQPSEATQNASKAEQEVMTEWERTVRDQVHSIITSGAANANHEVSHTDAKELRDLLMSRRDRLDPEAHTELERLAILLVSVL